MEELYNEYYLLMRYLNLSLDKINNLSVYERKFLIKN